MGFNGVPPHLNSNVYMNANAPMSFLPRISGASAFSNYTFNAANPASITNKVKIKTITPKDDYSLVLELSRKECCWLLSDHVLPIIQEVKMLLVFSSADRCLYQTLYIYTGCTLSLVLFPSC